MLALEQKNNLSGNRTFAGDGHGVGSLYANLVDVSFDGFIVCEYRSGIIVDINHKGCVLLGFDKQDLMGTSVWNRFQQLEAFVCRKRLEAKWQGKLKADSFKSYTLLKKDGAPFRANITGKIKKVLGQNYLFGSFREQIAETVRPEVFQQPRRQEPLDVLTRSIIHDLNNTLFPIMSNAEMTKVDLERANTSKILSRMDEILHAALHAKDLLQQVALFGKSRPSVTNEVAPLQTVVKEMVYLLKPAMQSSRIQIKESFPSEIISILGEAVRIRQTVQNLCMNAIQAMADTENGILKVELKKDEIYEDDHLAAGEYAMIVIKDNGCGIKPADIDRIFKDNYTTKKTGVHGIGLSVVQNIVDSLKGKVTVDSEDGKGSTFCVYLPVAVISSLQTDTQLRLVG